MAENKEKHLVVVDPEKLVISHSDYADMTQAEARVAIRKLLDHYNLGITPELISLDRAKTQLQGSELPDKVPGQVINDGITWVRCFCDGTEKTGQIKNGQPVVFDTVKGWGVTGIHESWAEHEYKILGIALADFGQTSTVWNQTTHRIPVRLKPPTDPRPVHTGLARIQCDPCDYTNTNGDPIEGNPLFLGMPFCESHVFKPIGATWEAITNFPRKIYNPLPFRLGNPPPGPGGTPCWVEEINGIWIVQRPFLWKPSFSATYSTAGSPQAPDRKIMWGHLGSLGDIAKLVTESEAAGGPPSAALEQKPYIKITCPAGNVRQPYQVNFSISFSWAAGGPNVPPTFSLEGRHRTLGDIGTSVIFFQEVSSTFLRKYDPPGDVTPDMITYLHTAVPIGILTYPPNQAHTFAGAATVFCLKDDLLFFQLGFEFPINPISNSAGVFGYVTVTPQFP